ncbi:recombinase family protein [Arthrobacter sp. Soil762]|uniref:recombinase family protein n=1 Tax=Arthrobacter sp. Soil762 TaxID=1736401 RepID=UPI00138F4AB4|nr:recombinase family protein [Arthrobacter sp. Soil762]
MDKIAVYARISQDKTGAGMAVENQLAAIKSWAEKHNHQLGTVYKDNDLSATSGKVRPAFEQLLLDKPKAVVVWHQDRLLRISKDLERVLDTEMTVYSVVAGSLDLSTPQGRAVARTVTAWNTYEGEQKAARQKLRSKADAEKGLWHFARPVFGNDRKTGALIEAEASAIREAAKKIADGTSTFFLTAKDWNTRGLLTPQTQGEWTPGTVRNFFLSERLIGKRTYEGVTYTLEGWEPILDEETWTQVQTYIDSLRTGARGVRTTSFQHLLSGIAECGVCGRKMNISYRGQRQGGARAYKCVTPGHLSRQADKLEEFILNDFLMDFTPETDALLNPAGTSDALAGLRALRIQMVNKHEQWITEALTESLSPSIIKAKEANHEREMHGIGTQIMEYEAENLFSGLVWDPKGESIFELAQGLQAFNLEVRKRWDVITTERKRRIVSAIYSKIVIHKGTQGKRFDSNLVELTRTELGEKLRTF